MQTLTTILLVLLTFATVINIIVIQILLDRVNKVEHLGTDHDEHITNILGWMADHGERR